MDGIKELVGNCTKAKNELVRKFSNFITLKIENHFNSKITLTVHQSGAALGLKIDGAPPQNFCIQLSKSLN